jgi:DNA polymerase III subunit gamma/tau
LTGQVLYRKWRPSRFEDIVGQQILVRTLKQAIANDRVAHAYLFSGPRGTGKTSTARVLAKGITCPNRDQTSFEPCGKCESCTSIDQGIHTDLIEIDGASNRGIDEIRSLREKAHFLPSRGTHKIYIIDEVHMLTNAASNAFLKTLEEPPPHTIFILCTTDPQKMEPTIISRCQLFDFHRLANKDISERLNKIAVSEGVDTSPTAMDLLAKSAGGSLRDATNLLDQLITSHPDNVSVEMIHEMLGFAPEEEALELVACVLRQDTIPAIKLVNDISSEGRDLKKLQQMTIECLRATLLLKHGVTQGIDLSSETQTQLRAIGSQVTDHVLMRALRVFAVLTLRNYQTPSLPFELAIFDLNSGEAKDTEENTETAQQGNHRRTETNKQHEPTSTRIAPSPASAPDTKLETIIAIPEELLTDTLKASVPAPMVSGDLLTTQWPYILKALKSQKGRRFNLEGLLNSSKTRYLEGSELVVRFTSKANSERLQEEMDDPPTRIAMEKILLDKLGRSYAIQVKLDDNDVQMNPQQAQSHLVRAALNLGGQLVSGSRDQDPWEKIQ